VTERRRFVRFETAMNAICDMVTNARKESLKVKNISKEGALLVLGEKLAEGSEIHLSFDVPGDNVPVFAVCEVAWQKGGRGCNLYETGVRFKKIDGPDRGRLLEYIYTQWLRFLDKS